LAGFDEAAEIDSEVERCRRRVPSGSLFGVALALAAAAGTEGVPAVPVAAVTEALVLSRW
jgi:hypothetical protein